MIRRKVKGWLKEMNKKRFGKTNPRKRFPWGKFWSLGPSGFRVELPRFIPFPRHLMLILVRPDKALVVHVKNQKYSHIVVLQER